MDENIFELLEEWDLAMEFRDREKEREIGHKIEALRKNYREGFKIKDKVKKIGIFSGDECKLMIDGHYFGSVWGLKYAGLGSDYDNTRMYSRDNVGVWLDYAVYE